MALSQRRQPFGRLPSISAPVANSSAAMTCTPNSLPSDADGAFAGHAKVVRGHRAKTAVPQLRSRACFLRRRSTWTTRPKQAKRGATSGAQPAWGTASTTKAATASGAAPTARRRRTRKRRGGLTAPRATSASRTVQQCQADATQQLTRGVHAERPCEVRVRNIEQTIFSTQAGSQERSRHHSIGAITTNWCVQVRQTNVSRPPVALRDST
jgi:hypothetical protein